MMDTEEIRKNLNLGLEMIDDKTLDELRSARNHALSHYHSHALAVEGHGAFHFHSPRIGIWLPVAALVLGICAILYWGTVTDAPAPDANDVDAALLADDLPVPAYTDQKFFDSWIKRSEP